MKNARFLWVAALFVVVAGCGGGGGASAPAETTNGGLVPPPPPGWRISEGPTPYTTDSLFEYLNGGAPLYLDYGFEGLTQTRYQLGDDPLACVTLDVFDMGSDLGAFGVYRSIVPPGAEVEAWGVEAYRSGAIAAAWRGSFYVHGEADDERPEMVDALNRLVSAAIESVEGPQALPPVLDILPRRDLVPGSERYVAVDLFGFAFLPGGVVASYTVDGGVADLFFSELAGPAEAEDALEQMRHHQLEWGSLGGDITDLGDGGFRFDDPGLGPGMVVRTGSFIVGVHGVPGGEELVRELTDGLPPE